MDKGGWIDLEQSGSEDRLGETAWVHLQLCDLGHVIDLCAFISLQGFYENEMDE